MQLEAVWPARRGAQCGGGLWTRLVYHIDDNGQVANAVSSAATQPLSQDLLFVKSCVIMDYFFLFIPHVFYFAGRTKIGLQRHARGPHGGHLPHEARPLDHVAQRRPAHPLV